MLQCHTHHMLQCLCFTYILQISWTIKRLGYAERLKLPQIKSNETLIYVLSVKDRVKNFKFGIDVHNKAVLLAILLFLAYHIHHAALLMLLSA